MLKKFFLAKITDLAISLFESCPAINVSTLFWNGFHHLAKKCGFIDPRLVDDSIITVNNKAVQETISKSGSGNLEFYSATYRLFKLDDTQLDPMCDDYGQAVIYKGDDSTL